MPVAKRLLSAIDFTKPDIYSMYEDQRHFMPSQNLVASLTIPRFGIKQAGVLQLIKVEPNKNPCNLAG